MLSCPCGDVVDERPGAPDTGGIGGLAYLGPWVGPVFECPAYDRLPLPV
jgi:hypothetical protein